MKKTIVLAAALAGAVGMGCGSKAKPAGTTTGSASAGSGSGSGSAMGSNMVGADMGSAAAVDTKPAPPPPPPPPPKTADEDAARYQECWGFWNDGKYDDFKGCYADAATTDQPGTGMPTVTGPAAIAEASKFLRSGLPDTKGALQLVLQNGPHTVGVALITGTHTDTFKTPMGDVPASKKKIGILMGHAVDFDDAGRAVKEIQYLDLATLMSQVGASKMPARKALTKGAKTVEVVIAKNDDKEKANLAAAQAMIDAFNKHDAKAYGALLADKVVWSEQPSAKDDTKKSLIAGSQAMWKGFSDLHFDVQTAWAAGDYVVELASFVGTNDGDVPMMKLKKTGKAVNSPFLAIQKFEGGKNTQTWIFYQGLDMAMQLGMMPPPGAAPKGK